MSLLLGFTIKQLIDEGRLTLQDILQLKQWVRENHNDVPDLLPEQIANFFFACAHDHEKTKQAILVHYKIRNAHPEIFNNRSMQNKAIQTAASILEMGALPNLTPEGYSVCFSRISDPNYLILDMIECLKLIGMSLDVDLSTFAPLGLIVLLDMNNMSLMHLTRMKVNLLKPIFQYVQKGLNVKLIRVHVFNAAYFLDKIMAILTPFLGAELVELLHFHPPNMDMEHFYKAYVPKNCLPADYGGDLPFIRTFHEENMKKLSGLQNYFDAEEAQRRTISVKM